MVPKKQQTYFNEYLNKEQEHQSNLIDNHSNRIKDKKWKKKRIQTLNSKLLDQSQISVNQQESRIQKRQIYSCQGLGKTEFPNKLKKFEELHEQDVIQLYTSIEQMNTEIQILN